MLLDASGVSPYLHSLTPASVNLKTHLVRINKPPLHCADSHILTGIPMQFTRLRLQGFKSFVEPTNRDIPPGLTGVVGPNGCGKSNLVEALRWVMGENSPKSMRGSEMDDVIFAGTATRPSRNLAKVGLMLDNSNRSATTEFNNEEMIEVTREIERGS